MNSSFNSRLVVAVAITALLVATSCVCLRLLATLELLEFGGAFSWDSAIALLTLFSALPAAVMAFYGCRDELVEQKNIQKRDLYQHLELASIDLFRHEIDNRDLFSTLWSKDKMLPEAGSGDHYALTQYCAQVLNLFEMATEFRKQNIIDANIYSTWVPWIYEFSRFDNFRPLWESSLSNQYTETLTKQIEIAVQEASESSFYLQVSRLHNNCEYIRKLADG